LQVKAENDAAKNRCDSRGDSHGVEVRPDQG
jgi:hypothetical protein